ncbi:hypothetical protein Bca52824_030304 [Brassica carinata]|uniref:Transcription factor TFIIB cyclin-like domain-containing protein n=1 Tax=Brassica carinata TaxID=52824 RepID=A0A8X7S8X6_BRACI|nr:hypothetical protein Bca52824_030304 [Brassica carinata]
MDFVKQIVKEVKRVISAVKLEEEEETTVKEVSSLTPSAINNIEIQQQQPKADITSDQDLDALISVYASSSRPTNPLLADSALTTVIAKTNGSSGDFLSNSLGRWQNRNGSAERGLIQAFKTITMFDMLGLVGTIKDRANEIFKRLENQKSTKGRNQDALFAACLYISYTQGQTTNY